LNDAMMNITAESHRAAGRRCAVLLFAGLLARPLTARGEDWPQLQHDAARTGQTPDTVRPPYRARWAWFGPDWILRNKESRPGGEAWEDDLTSGKDTSYRMPKAVPFCFAGSMQPIVVAEVVYVGDAQGKVYARATASLLYCAAKRETSRGPLPEMAFSYCPQCAAQTNQATDHVEVDRVNRRGDYCGSVG
jgi:hypothetical protein